MIFSSIIFATVELVVYTWPEYAPLMRLAAGTREKLPLNFPGCRSTSNRGCEGSPPGPSLCVAQVSAEHPNLSVCPSRSDACVPRATEGARRCSEVRDGNGRLHLARGNRDRRWSCTLTHASLLRKYGCPGPPHAFLKSLKPRTRVALFGTQGRATSEDRGEEGT